MQNAKQAAAAREKRRPYIPPAVTSEDTFEVLALSCATEEDNKAPGGGCPIPVQNS